MIDARAQPGVKARGDSLPVLTFAWAFRLDPDLTPGRWNS